jgi:hypothetical protein
MPLMRLLLFLAAMVLPVAGWALDLRTADGLGLQLNAAGAVTGVRLGAAEAPLSGAGGFFVADVAGIPPGDQELLPNPGFEVLDAGLPVGWNVGNDWSLDTTAAHTGTACMRVYVPGPEKACSGALAVTVPVQPNRLYRVSMWLRTQRSAPYLYVVQQDAAGAGRDDTPQICVSHARTNSDWFPLTHTLVTAPFCRVLRVYTNLWEQTGEAWVDDVSVTAIDADLISPQQPVVGELQPVPDGVRQQCVLAGQGLTLEATTTVRGDCLEIAGVIADTTGRERALTLSYRLPITGVGWRWFDDLRSSQPVEPALIYGSARPFGERRTLALYPFAALGSEQAALALAVPMDMPRVFRLCFEAGKGFFINYEFGLSPEALKTPGRASFRFLLYRLDPQWGFRSAARRYYDLFPQFFSTRLSRPGPAGFMVAPEMANAPGYCFPAVAIWDYNQRASLDAYRRELTGLFSYTEFAGWWGWALGITAAAAASKPSAAEAWAHVEGLAAAKPPNDAAQCIVNCAPYDRDGKPVLSESYMPEWGGYNYTCNPDPEITGSSNDVNRYRLTCSREVAQVDGYGLAGLYIDCVFVATTDNFRREHFRTADHPLAFDHISKRPVLPLPFSVYECTQALCDDMHARGKAVLSNYSVTDCPTDMFCIRFIDLIGNEMLGTWTTDTKFSLQRVLAYRKPISMSWQEAKSAWPEATLERELKQAMFYGTYYHLSTLSPVLQERWAPLTDRLARAGWEPITLAEVAAPVLVERFGRSAERNLHFTLRGGSVATAAARLQLDAAALGLARATDQELWLARDASGFEPLTTERAGARWTVAVPVPAGDTVVVRVGSPRDLGLDFLLAVPELLRLALNYREALLAANVAVAGPDYAAALKATEEAIDQVRAGAGASLAAIEAAMAPPLVQPAEAGDAERAAWPQRLSRRDAEVRARLRAAAPFLSAVRP